MSPELCVRDVTSCGTDDYILIPYKSKNVYLHLHVFRSALWSTQLPIKHESGTPFSSVKRPECEIDRSPL